MAHELKAKSFQVPRITLLALFFFITVFLAIGCSTETELKGTPVPEPGPEEGPVPFEVLRRDPSGTQTVVSCRFKPGIFDPGSVNQDSLSKHELVIDNQIDFDTYISCDDTVGLNFDEEYVLAGLSSLQPVVIRLQTITAELENDSLYLRVGLLNGHSTSPSRAEYIIKVASREYVRYPVVFNVYWEQ